MEYVPIALRFTLRHGRAAAAMHTRLAFGGRDAGIRQAIRWGILRGILYRPANRAEHPNWL